MLCNLTLPMKSSNLIIIYCEITSHQTNHLQSIASPQAKAS